ncbi:MAG: hypothetical protein PVF66_12965 [Candidatus Aminicenantes bacterium]|jgi:hypothetical protein
MEEKLLLILLGAGLGFLIKSYSERTQQAMKKKKQEGNQKKEDRLVLTKILDTLSEFMEKVEPGKSEKSPIRYLDELFSLSFKIQHEENKLLANEVQYFVQEHREYDPSFYKSMREDIESLKSKLEGMLRYG